jgi:hypothetical protein
VNGRVQPNGNDIDIAGSNPGVDEQPFLGRHDIEDRLAPADDATFRLEVQVRYLATDRGGHDRTFQDVLA